VNEQSSPVPRDVQDDRANWDVQSAANVDDWKPDCAQVFKEAVARARRKFDNDWTSE